MCRDIAIALLSLALGCSSAGHGGRGQAGLLRVGTSADYAPFSFTTADSAPGHWADSLEGFDPAVARAYASDRGLRIEWVRFAWPNLLADLEAGRFDVAMSGVTVRSERAIAGRFTVPVARSGAVLLTRLKPDGVVPTSLAEIDRPGARIAVNKGGHLERVARKHIAHATVVAIPDNDAVRDRLISGDFASAITDTQEAPHWREQSRDLVQIGPFTRDRKAYLVRADQNERAQDLDRWLLAREVDGSLAALRRQHLGSAQTPDATGPVLQALLASIDERLSLMPWVAEAKRTTGAAIEAPEREERVLDAAVASAQRAARAGALPAPKADALRALFRAQIEAAKHIQRRQLSRGRQPEIAGADLALELRPALIRIGDRIATLCVQLLRSVDGTTLRAAAAKALSARDLDEAHVNAIADALQQLRA